MAAILAANEFGRPGILWARIYRTQTMGLSWVLLTLAVGVQPTEFHIETDTPDALCPELQLARDAVKKRLGQLVVDGGGTWQGRYSTVHDPAGRHGDYVRLVITDPSGKEQLTRDLPMRGESCATMAQALALVVDSFFRDFGQSPAREAAKSDTDSPDSSVASASNGPAARNSNPDHTGVAVPAAGSSPARPLQGRARAGVSLGGGYESVPSSAAAVAGLFIEPSAHFRLDVRTTLPFSRVHEVHGNATAYLYPVPFRLSMAYQGPLSGQLTGFIGPELLVSFERGSGTGITSGHSGWREAFGVGGRIGAAYWLSAEFALAANVSMDAILAQTRRFLVVDEPTLEISRARLTGTLELWVTLF